MHRKALDKLFQELSSRPEGLKTEEAQKILAKIGPNTIKTKTRPLWFIEFLKEFLDLMVIILIIACIIAFAFNETTDATVILSIIILNATVGFVQKYRAERAVEALQAMVAPHARVLRDGQRIEIPAEDLVPGDILLLEEGVKITADARVIESYQLECNESVLTGESTPTKKEVITLKGKYLPKIEHNNTVFTGTIITHGAGKAIVIATGDKTEFGKITKLTAETKQDLSPLQKELKRIGIFIAILTLAVSSIIFVAGHFFQGKLFIDNLIFTISVAVAAVPEGLPATITIALALGVQRLAKKNAITKQLSSVETLGATTVILSDKTGTLTQNEMTIKEIFLNNQYAEVSGIGYAPVGEVEFFEEKTAHTKEALKWMATIGVLCNEARLNKTQNNRYELIGDPTEGSILTFIKKAGFSFRELADTNAFLEKLPFDSERKRMSAVVKNLKSHQIFVLTKGAPLSILEKCTGVLINGKKIDLTKAKKAALLKQSDEMSKKALRVIAFAYKEMPKKQKDKYTEAATENNLTFVGFVGMIDPPRKDVAEAIALTKEAGIKTYIVTGDNGFTAEAIARKIGLITSEKYEIITGNDLNKISKKKLIKLLSDKEKEIIFARVSPQHKLKIADTVKELGEIVAVTGDGVNDAPALKRADIGIAMGITGTDVSKEAANMILADDSFSTIVRAIEEGRTVYSNMKKFIFYIFSCNIGELILIFGAILISLPTPLTAVLILTVNVGTDILPALALGVEPIEKDIMSSPPRNPKKHLINARFASRFAYIGVFIAAIVTGVFTWNLYRYGWSFGDTLDTNTVAYMKSTTMAFATLVVIQLFNAYNARSQNKSILSIGFFKNPFMIIAILISAGLLYGITEIPLFQNYLSTTSITGTEWAIILVSSSFILLIEETRKILFKI
ncbi:cation-transporting P-type ATPase [Candidatus Peregrinibacteria bacterium]|jgi:P-type Ca2+ transporter type 2C|nr:cation-transporting P-type ATPase [Candidatus Peregrinibacteria bacterium]MBT4147887.1 cation-transporting P-type ATPase [Candidatus Peregrinibacteria bacterium]MBT4456378.1 cation-transporting P-type ATPase [Candidatus Peregrinibacteria bacterium]